MAKQETLRVAEKDLNSFEHAELLKIVINQKKAELDDLNHKVLLAKNNLRLVEESCQRQQSEFNQRLAQEKQNLENLKNQKKNEFAHQEEKNQQAIRLQNERETRLQEKENAQVKLDIERKALYQERINLEKARSNYEEQTKRTLALQSEAENKLNQASQKLAGADKKLAEAKQLNSSAEYQLNQVKELDKKTRADLDNIQKIKEGIAPRLAELEAKKKENEKILAEAKEREANAVAKVEEDEKLTADLKKQYEAFKSKELEIATREGEVLKQEIIIKKVKEEK